MIGGGEIVEKIRYAGQYMEEEEKGDLHASGKHCGRSRFGRWRL
jgi:hypothetical protein